MLWMDYFKDGLFYGQGTETNWNDPEYYYLAISPEGGLPAWSYGDIPGDHCTGAAIVYCLLYLARDYCPSRSCIRK